MRASVVNERVEGTHGPKEHLECKGSDKVGETRNTSCTLKRFGAKCSDHLRSIDHREPLLGAETYRREAGASQNVGSRATAVATWFPHFALTH